MTDRQTITQYLAQGGKIKVLPSSKPASNRTFRKVRGAKVLRSKPQV